MRLSLLGCMLILTFGTPAWAAGTIRGTIWPTRAEARRAALERADAKQQKPGFGTRLHTMFRPASDDQRRRDLVDGFFAARRPPRPSDLADAVVSVQAIPAKVERRLAIDASRRGRATATMAVDHPGIQPRVVAVAAGEPARLGNSDHLWHGAFGVSPARRIDLGKLRPGATVTLPTAKPGVINVLCELHSGEIGYLRVVPNHAYARSDSLGRFVLPKLPPGEYQIEIWHPVRGSRQSKVVVPETGNATCDLAF